MHGAVKLHDIFGVRTYDARSGQMFKLHSAVLWCIHDLPALSTLSGRTTKGYFACTHCDKDPLSYALRSKIGYFGHFRFLPRGHRLRRNNEFAGIHKSNDPPSQFTTEELMAELEKVKDVRPGKQQVTGKRKHSDMDGDCVKIWSRMVSLWKLPYWKKLMLRHNLDVMHIEENICENLTGTICNVSVKARLDLKDLGIRKRKCHYSKKKKGYTPAVQLVINEMENKISAPTEGEQPISATQVVAEVHAEKTKKSQFLQNVGIQITRPRSSSEDLEAQLEAEKREKNELARQVKVLSKQVQETEQGRIRDQEEMSKKQADLEAKFELLLSKMQPP